MPVSSQAFAPAVALLTRARGLTIGRPPDGPSGSMVKLNGKLVGEFLDRFLGEMDRLFERVLGKVFWLVLPLLALMLPLREPIVALLFEFGAFDDRSTATTSPLLGLYLISAPAIIGGTLLMRGFFALQAMVLPMVLVSLVAALSVPLYWLMSQRMGVEGIALASTLTMWAQFLVLAGAWSRRRSCRTASSASPTNSPLWTRRSPRRWSTGSSRRGSNARRS